MENTIFYFNDDWGCVQLDMTNENHWTRIDKGVGYLRKIINARGVFRCEDLDTICWNSDIFKKKRCVSGSTYVQDGNLQLFIDSISEIEKKVISFRI